MQEFFLQKELPMNATMGIPERVALRTIRKRKRPDCVYEPDAELDTIIARAEGNTLCALACWYVIAKTRLPVRSGVYFIPLKMQEFLGLPVRQVYIDRQQHRIFRVECDGRVAEQLL